MSDSHSKRQPRALQRPGLPLPMRGGDAGLNTARCSRRVGRCPAAHTHVREPRSAQVGDPSRCLRSRAVQCENPRQQQPRKMARREQTRTRPECPSATRTPERGANASLRARLGDSGRLDVAFANARATSLSFTSPAAISSAPSGLIEIGRKPATALGPSMRASSASLPNAIGHFEACSPKQRGKACGFARALP